jgi:predicted dinucleotide-binding enzyme
MSEITLIRRDAMKLAVAAALSPGAAFAAAAVPEARPFVGATTRHPLPKTASPMKIGIVGSGNVGGNLGEVFTRAGHSVMFSDRDPAAAKARAERAPGSRTGTVNEAIAFGDIVVLAVPLVVFPDFAKENLDRLKGKILIDVSNPNAQREGQAMYDAVIAEGTGTYVARLFPGIRVVRAFSSFGAESMGSEAGRPGEKVGIPLASNDRAAMDTVARLVSSSGFEPVIVGDAASARKFEQRQPGNGVHTASELRRLVGVG